MQQGTGLYPFGTPLVPTVILVQHAYWRMTLMGFFVFFSGQNVPQLSFLHTLDTVSILCSLQLFEALLFHIMVPLSS